MRAACLLRLCRPTVETEQVSGLRDVQRFFVLLQPQQPSGGSCRLIIIGKKKLPSPTKHERYFAFVGEQRQCLGITTSPPAACPTGHSSSHN